MDDKKMEKYAAIGGIVFVVLNIIGTVLQGTPPKLKDANAKILKWYTDKDSGIQLAGFLGALSVIALLWWFGTLWKRMTTADGGSTRVAVISLAGLVGSGVAFMTSTAINSAVTMRTADLGEGSGFFYTLSGVLLAVSGAFVATHLLATNLLALRTKLFPTWHAGIGLLAALGFVASSAGLMTDSNAMMAIGMVSFLLWAVWILLTSVQMWRTSS